MLLTCGCTSDDPTPGVDERCTREATQEDLLCDVCRVGCFIITVRLGEEQPNTWHSPDFTFHDLPEFMFSPSGELD